MRGPVMETMVWLRVPGDVIFAAGALMLVVCVAEAWRRSRGAPATVPGREPATLHASGEH